MFLSGASLVCIPLSLFNNHKISGAMSSEGTLPPVFLVVGPEGRDGPDTPCRPRRERCRRQSSQSLIAILEYDSSDSSDYTSCDSGSSSSDSSDDEDTESTLPYEHSHDHTHEEIEQHELLIEMNALKIELNKQLTDNRLHEIEKRLDELEKLDLREILKATQDHDPDERARKLLEEVKQWKEAVGRTVRGGSLKDA